MMKGILHVRGGGGGGGSGARQNMNPMMRFGHSTVHKSTANQHCLASSCEPLGMDKQLSCSQLIPYMYPQHATPVLLIEICKGNLNAGIYLYFTLVNYFMKQIASTQLQCSQLLLASHST